jgi:hypothetical protein
MSPLPFHCMICDKYCSKPFNGLCEKCQREEITSYKEEEE